MVGELLEENTMTTTKKVGMLAAVAMIAGLQTGCLIVGSSDGGWSWGLGGSRQKATSELTIEAEGVSKLDVRTHNGAIAYTGGAGSSISVVAKKTGGAFTLGDAQAALDAIEVYIEDAGDGRKMLSWRWSTPKHRTWSGAVSFTINGPSNLALDVKTHNGGVRVDGVDGDVKAVTHNGGVVATSANGSLVVETHNGGITADYAGSSISLATHNGGVQADLSECGRVAGNITTHNGGIRVVVGEATAADLDFATRNGRIRTDGEIEVREVSRRRLEGTIGEVGGGGSPLTVRTHNGAIRLKTTG